MPEPGNAMTPFGRKYEQLVVAAEGCGLAVGVPVGPADELVDAARIGPTGCDLLDAGAAAVHQDHVAVLRARAVEVGPDGVGTADGLAAGDDDKGCPNDASRCPQLRWRLSRPSPSSATGIFALRRTARR